MPTNRTIQSPCISVCTIEPDLDVCRGCLRTRTEIARWLSYTDQERAHIMDALPARHAEYSGRLSGSVYE